MMEFQAVGRVVRLGQTKPVTVYRYIMATTVEEVILSPLSILNSEASIRC